MTGGVSLEERLTSHLHYVPWDDVSGFDPLDSLAVHAIHLSHLRFILFQSFDGILSIALLSKEMYQKMEEEVMPRAIFKTFKQIDVLINLVESLALTCYSAYGMVKK